MIIRNTTLLFFFATVLSSISSVAQSTRDHTSNTHAWIMYFGNHKVSERFGIHVEVQIRRHELFSEWQQLLLRTGLDYYLKDNSRFTLGYCFVETDSYGEFGVPNAFPEHRIWQQFFSGHSIGKVRLTHRYRLEQRMIGNASTGRFENGRYENRFRYMVKATRPLSEKVFIAFYNEVFLNAGRDVAYNIFDQNRLYGALGFNLSGSLKLELGYLYQAVQLRSLNGADQVRVEDNHTLQIGLFSNLPFFKASGE